ncbi:hypothetical protein HanXRQr2_Chr06g0243741 [Helianthus annuus]|uniref:Uncharacterized protein n=1 Tax=Helianthus annuus TaxID=4232 RepID=A0A9K3IQI7_HELAN|nr:hypothetical protein HanXRQr2_Chr06g0243741 [Helianthus annuus]
MLINNITPSSLRRSWVVNIAIHDGLTCFSHTSNTLILITKYVMWIV